MEKPTEELTKRMDLLVQTFANIGQQLKEMQDIIAKNVVEVNQVKIEQRAQDLRVRRLEEEKLQDRLRINVLEDRSRRANIRLRGFKQNFAEGRDMIQNVRQWLKDNEIEIEENMIERTHWAFGTRKGGIQRDIIIKFLSEKTATEVYKALKKISNLNCKGTPIRVLKDLSMQTLQARNKMRPIADALFQKGIRFTWQYPAIILVFKDGRVYRAKSLDEGKELFSQLGFKVDLSLQAEKGEAVLDASEIFGAVGGEGVKSSTELFASASQLSEEKVGGEIEELEERLAFLKKKESKEMRKEDPPMEARVTRQKKK